MIVVRASVRPRRTTKLRTNSGFVAGCLATVDDRSTQKVVVLVLMKVGAYLTNRPE